MTIAAYAPHEVRDRIKLSSMIRALRRDGRTALPACWAEGDETGHGDCFEGSHRLAAWERMGMRPRITLISTDELDSAAKMAGYDNDADMMDHCELEDITDILDAWAVGVGGKNEKP